MLHENGNTRQFNGRGEGATIARQTTTEEAARRAAALIGEDSPLRPGFGGTGRASAEFAGTLSRLGDAFAQLRASLQAVEERIEGLQGAVDKSASGLDQLRERVQLEDARLASFHQRLAGLEAKQCLALEGIQTRVADLTRQVSIALAVAIVLATLSIVTLVVVR